MGDDRLLFGQRQLGKAHFCATYGKDCSADQQQQTVCVTQEVSSKYNKIIVAANCHKMGQRGLHRGELRGVIDK